MSGTHAIDQRGCGLAEHFGANGGVPDAVHALVPFTLRPLDEPLPQELGNRFGLVVLGPRSGRRPVRSGEIRIE